jgi:O-antigen ligase
LGPNLQALSLLLPLVIAIQRAFGRAERHRLLNALVATLMVWGIFMTGSRTGTLVAAISLLTMALGSPRQVRTPMLAAFAVTVAAGVLVWVYQPAGVATRSFESVTSSSGRLDIWTVGLAACEEHCYYGSGWGTFPQVYADTQASVPGARVLAGDQGSYQPHNLWLLAAIELGLPGLLLLLWGLAAAFLDAVRLPQELRGPPLSAIVGLSVGVFFLSSMEFKFFWIVLIMIALYRNLSDTRVPPSEGQVRPHRSGTSRSAPRPLS